jgi:hypothetical protein
MSEIEKEQRTNIKFVKLAVEVFVQVYGNEENCSLQWVKSFFLKEENWSLTKREIRTASNKQN